MHSGWAVREPIQSGAPTSDPLIPPPLVTGKDFIALGLHSGPRFKEILEEAQTAQLEGKITTREEALEIVREHLRG